MNSHDDADRRGRGRGSSEQDAIPQLVAAIYEKAPAPARCRLLEHLMQPIGVLSLVGVANGVFAKLWFRRGWHKLQILPEDTELVRASDVMDLVDHAQHVCMDAVDTLAQVVTTWPIMTGSAAAAVLVAALLARAQRRRADAHKIGNPSNASES